MNDMAQMHRDKGEISPEASTAGLNTGQTKIISTQNEHSLRSTNVFVRTYRWFTASAWRVFALVCVVCLALPTGFTIEMPGPTQNVLGNLGQQVGASGKNAVAAIQVTGVKTHKESGKLLFTTVNVEGIPEQPSLVAENVWGWVSPHAVVYPSEVFFPAEQTGGEYEAEQKNQMSSAQSSAVLQAKKFLSEKGIDVSAVRFTLGAGDVGGPSAGLMFTLGAITRVTPEDETNGVTIAGTGTMEKDGKVGPIGGVRLKLLGARRDGAKWFLVPASDCAEAYGHIPEGIRDVRVSTLSEAYDAVVAIGQGKAASLPHCTAKG